MGAEWCEGGVGGPALRWAHPARLRSDATSQGRPSWQGERRPTMTAGDGNRPVAVRFPYTNQQPPHQDLIRLAEKSTGLHVLLVACSSGNEF